MFEPTRDQVREFFFETWRKGQAGEVLTGMEALALEVVLLHPEYHAVLSDPGRYREQEYFPELGQSNPFLHLSLHLALEEQLSIDQPRGIVARFAALLAGHGERHAALHDALECLAEMVWRAQRERAEPDGAAYLECLEARARR
jgi:hypothetical protein